jgi:hypothetical protein
LEHGPKPSKLGTTTWVWQQPNGNVRTPLKICVNKGLLKN